MIFWISGCTVNVSTNYAPSISLDGNGELTIENFSFYPDGYAYDDKDKIFKNLTSSSTLRENEIYIGLPASILLEKPIDQFITEAVKKEFKLIGYKNVKNSNISLTGKVKVLAIEKGFFSSDFVTKIEFTAKDKNKTSIFTRVSEGRFQMGETHTKEPTTALYTSISRSIEDFVRAAQDNGILQR